MRIHPAAQGIPGTPPGPRAREETDLVSRAGQARLDKLLAEQDLLHVGTDRASD